jgi:hypothetical protein
MNIALAVAAFLSLLTWGIHTFEGGPRTVKPLLASAMRPVPKYTNYYCWHLVTFVLLTMAGGFAYAAVFPSGLDIAVLLTVLSAGFTLWSLALVALSRRKLLELPQWALFAPITAAALVGILV